MDAGTVNGDDCEAAEDKSGRRQKRTAHERSAASHFFVDTSTAAHETKQTTSARRGKRSGPRVDGEDSPTPPTPIPSMARQSHRVEQNAHFVAQGRRPSVWLRHRRDPFQCSTSVDARCHDDSTYTDQLKHLIHAYQGMLNEKERFIVTLEVCMCVCPRLVHRFSTIDFEYQLIVCQTDLATLQDRLITMEDQVDHLQRENKKQRQMVTAVATDDDDDDAEQTEC